METRKSKTRESIDKLSLNKNKSKKIFKIYNFDYQRKYLFKYYPDTGKFIKSIS